MSKRSFQSPIRRWLSLCLAAALLAPAAPLGAVTPAGTQIRNVAAGQYQIGATPGSVTSNEAVTTVALAPAVRLAPASANGSVPAGRTYYFAHTVTNLGNGADTFDLSATSSQGWPIILYLDDNNDGLHQSGETTAVTTTGALAAGADFHFFVAASIPKGIASGASSVVTLVGKSRANNAVSDQAQDTLGAGGASAIKGSVNWAGRASATGVQVAALDSSQTPVASTSTSSSGSFELSGLAAGTYTVQISGDGMAPQSRGNLAVDGVSSVTCDFTAVAQPQFASGLQMMTVPLGYANSDPAAVTGITSGLKLAWWSPQMLRYLVYGADAGFPGFAPGRGFWLQTGGGAPSPTLAATGTLAVQTQDVSVPLAPGWNLVGSPFVTSVTWANCRVRRNGQVVDLATAGQSGWIRPYLWGYDPAAGQYTLVHATYPDAQRMLEPWQGYWIRALVACDLLVSPATTVAAAPTRAAEFKPSANNWRVRLVASAGSKSDGFNVLGVAPDAAANDPTYRLAAPPPASQSVDLSFVRDLGASEALATDVRAPAPGKMVWTMRVKTDLAPTPVTLSWPDLSQVPGQYRVTLVDLDAHRRQYMRTTTAYVFNAGAGGGERRFQIEFDPTPWARLQVAGMRQMAPPPQGVALSYTLSADAAVTIQVRALSGRVVRLLCANETRTAGAQLFTWDGRDASGRMMPAGPYLCEISAVTDEGQAVKGMRTVLLAR